MNREEMAKQLYITDDTPANEVIDKLHCAALIPEGTEVIARVLKRYLNMRELYWGRIKEVKG